MARDIILSSSMQRLQMDGSIRAPAISTLSHRQTGVMKVCGALEECESEERWFPHCCWQSPALRDTSITEHHSTAFTLLSHRTLSFNPQRLTLNVSPIGNMHSMHFSFLCISLISEILIVVYNVFTISILPLFFNNKILQHWKSLT